MANYNAEIRTNYFKIKNTDDFSQFINNIDAESDIEIFDHTDENGNKLVGFGVDGMIGGYGEDRDEDGYIIVNEETSVARELQKLIADDDAAIIFETGYEKLNYVTGFAEVITNNKIEYLSLNDLAIEKAKIMLNNPDWQTTTEY